MLESVLPWVEVLILSSYLNFLQFFLDKLVLLFLGELLAIKPDKLSTQLLFNLPLGLLSALLLLVFNRKVRLLLLKSWLFLIVKGSLELDLDVCLNHADLVLRLTVCDINEIISALVVDVDGVSLHKTRVIGQLLFQTINK